MLDVDMVVQYTNGRLTDNDETERMLAAALAAARHYCGWHVNPVIVDDEQTFDGPGDQLLFLPTKKLVPPLTEITEDGVTLSVTDLTTSESGRIVVKRSGMCWSNKFRAITVKMTHGFTDEEAADWQGAVLSAIDRMSPGAMAGATLVAGPFQFTPGSLSGQSIFSMNEQAIFDTYSLKMI